MDKIYDLAERIAKNYAWEWKFEEGSFLIKTADFMNDEDRYKYNSPKELIADWYYTMEDSNEDYYKSGDISYRIWKEEDIELAEKIYKEVNPYGSKIRN